MIRPRIMRPDLRCGRRHACRLLVQHTNPSPERERPVSRSQSLGIHPLAIGNHFMARLISRLWPYLGKPHPFRFFFASTPSPRPLPAWVSPVDPPRSNPGRSICSEAPVSSGLSALGDGFIGSSVSWVIVFISGCDPSSRDGRRLDGTSLYSSISTPFPSKL